MAKRQYADVVMNGQTVNVSIRASSEKEARTKLATLPEWKAVTEIIAVSPNPPRKHEREEIEMPLVRSKKHRPINMYTGGKVFTY